MFDTQSMYNEQQQAAAAAAAAEQQEQSDVVPQSRHVSSSSSTTTKRSHHKRSFLGKLIPRRESSADFHDPQQQKSQSRLASLKHKASESFLPLRSSPQPSSQAPSPRSSVVASSNHNQPQQQRHRTSNSSANGDGGNYHFYTFDPRRRRSKSSASQQQNHPPPQSALESFPKELLKDYTFAAAGNNLNSGKMFTLDTDTSQMQGIVQQDNNRHQHDFMKNSNNDNDNDINDPISTNYNNNYTNNNTATNNDSNKVPKKNNRTSAQSIDSNIEYNNNVKDPQTNWMPPESWGVIHTNEGQKWGFGFDHENSISTNTAPQVNITTSTDTSNDNSNANGSQRRKSNHCLRVFREDGTFGTLSCPIDISVAELLQLLARKFFMNSITGYQLSVRTGGLTRVLQPLEKPLIFQKMLLEFMGYTEKDRLGDVGREDLSYLCRFEFTRTTLLPSFTPEEESLMSRDFSHVNLQRMDLQTIPILFYQHAAEIETLDVSRNPSITIPLDFLQACTNLRNYKFVDNQAKKFPPNLKETPYLTSLDLSNNLILDLDHVNFDEIANLTTLNLQGNRLNAISDSIATLTHLKHLNLSSNNLTEVPFKLCEINTLIELDLSFNHITALPENIGKLTQLERLSMTNNDLVKQLPESFSDLISLKELDVRYNKLHNIDVLAKLPKLEILYCSKNSVYSFEDSFSRLKLFYFDRNPITRISLNECHYNLAVLNLSKAKLTALSENVLEKIPMVEKLVLDKNHLVTLPPQIGSLKNLITLSVVSNNLSAIPPEIGLLQELQTLDLHGNNLKSLPEEIWNMSSLANLNASSNLLEAFPKPNYHVSSVSSTATSDTSNGKKAGGANNSNTVSSKMGGATNLDSNYEMRTVNNRRVSEYSTNSALDPTTSGSRRGSSHPRQANSPENSRNASITPYDNNNNAAAAAAAVATTSHNSSTTTARGGKQGLAQSLLVLSLGDNRLNDECFEELAKLTELQVLNLSYNDLIEVPAGALGRLPRLTELYLSGNRLSGLPSDDFENNQSLRVFHVNANKLHSLPAELGKMSHLGVLDVGSNNLRYNINNWPYDWNWNFNLNLKYLNFSGNQKLEIKTLHNQGVRGDGERNLSDFTVLSDIRVLGLMDVTLTTPSVPDQAENCRVRTYGSRIMSMGYGMADSVGNHDNLSMMDMVIERFRGKEKEIVVGLFDGRNELEKEGNKVSKLIQETFGTIFAEELNKLREDETTADALRRAFLHTNKEIGNTTMLPTEEIAHSSIAHRSSTAANLNPHDHMTGSCATIVYIAGSKMYVANVGDSMAVLSKGNGEYTVLTERHDPTAQAELARIRGGAGVVSSTGKLDGVLDVSRAIGFYNLVPHIHSAPYISEYDLTGADDFLILASKQLWEHVSFEMAADVARTELDNPMLAAQKLRDFAIAYGCNDKLMVMVLAVGSINRKKQSRPGFGSGGTGSGVNNNHYGSLPGVEEELFPLGNKRRRAKSVLPEDSTLARLGGEVEPPVGDVAMVFTDIKNSTLLWETYPVAMRSAIKVHNSIMRRHIRIMGGYEVKTEGDAFIVSFPTPISALLWCFSVQSQLLVADWPTEILESQEGYEVLDDSGEVIFRGLSVRMGIHWGSPVSETDVITKRMDYFGPMVNRTARISAVADGGQITISSDFLMELRRLEEAHKQVNQQGLSYGEAYGDEAMGESLDRYLGMLDNLGLVVKDLGEMKLKGLENPEWISVAYPKSLQGRLGFHNANREENNNANNNNAATAANNTNINKQLTQNTARPYGISLEVLTKLRTISNRLEKICSSMNKYPTDFDEEVMTPQKWGTYNRKTSRNLLSVIPNNDEDYALFLEHIVTRVENAISTLYIRAAMGKMRDQHRNDPYAGELSDMLITLRDMMMNMNNDK